MRDQSRPTPPATNNRKRTSRGKAWLTAGTVAAYAAVSITRAMPACAQDVHATPANTKEQNLMVRRWDIPAGPLDAAISAYKRTTGVDVTLSLPAETVAGFKSPGVNGLYTDDQALTVGLFGLTFIAAFVVGFLCWKPSEEPPNINYISPKELTKQK